MSDRLEFSESTKKVIGASAQWYCSAPGCKATAMGAADGVTLNGGTACHIFSSATGGPRGRGGLSDDEIKSSNNGIWCCATHGRLIDANEGGAYPASQLYMWKRLAEGKTRRAMAMQYSELGWFRKFELSVLLKPNLRWRCFKEFQKNNILVGESGAGKSLILEGLASVSANRHAWRLRSFHGYSIELNYETITKENLVEAHFVSTDNVIERRSNGLKAALPPPDMVVLFSTSAHIRRTGDYTGFAFLAEVLEVDRDAIIALAKTVSDNGDSGIEIKFKEIELSDIEEDSDIKWGNQSLMVKLRTKDFFLPFNALSSGEKAMVSNAFLIALAREEAKSRPVLLCIDSLGSLDQPSFRRELKKLAEEPIQLLVVSPAAEDDVVSQMSISGWHRIDVSSITDMLDVWESAQLGAQ